MDIKEFAKLDEEEWVDEASWDHEAYGLYIPYKNAPLMNIDQILEKIEIDLPNILRDNFNKGNDNGGDIS